MMSSEISEQFQLVDISTFESLFHKYKRLVYRTAYLITGDTEDAKDIMQEVFISVWKSRRTFNPKKGKLTTWLHRITVNECSKKKNKKRLDFSYLEEFTEQNYRLSESSVLPESIVIKKDENEALMKVLSTLDTNHRSVIVLRFFNDLSYNEIAEITSTPLGTVKSRMYYALESLRKKLSD